MTKGNYFTMAKAEGQQKAKIDIYGDIVSEDWRWSETETSAVSFRDSLNALGEDINELDIHINSGGGNVFEAVAIYNMLKRHKAKVNVHIDGLAASAASVIAMAADNLHMPSNSMMMIHNAWSVFMGNHHELREFATQLEKINNTAVKQSYIEKNPDIDVDELSSLMDKETWLTAQEALEMGLADEVTNAVQTAASITAEQLARYENAPSALKDPTAEPEALKVVLTATDGGIEESFKALREEMTALANKIEAQESKEPAKPAEPSAMSKFFLNLN